MSEESDKSKVYADLAVEYGEIGFKELVEQSKQYIPALTDVSSEVPYVKTAIAAIKLPRTISDILLGLKIKEFLYSSGMSQEKVNKLKEKLDSSKRARLWERVVFSINNHDDKQKSAILGKLFSALVDDKIDEQQFFNMVHATNSINLATLELLKDFYDLSYQHQLPSSVSYGFTMLGLINVDNSGINKWGGAGPTDVSSQLGWIYVGIVYDLPNSSLEGVPIGKDTLIKTLDDKGQVDNAYPLNYIKAKGLHYQEADLFVMNTSKQVLCEQDTLLPKIIASTPVQAGENGNGSAERLVRGRYNLPRGIRIRNMEDTSVQKWASVTVSDECEQECIFRSTAEIEATLTNSRPEEKTDYTRYLMDVNNEFKRIASGEI